MIPIRKSLSILSLIIANILMLMHPMILHHHDNMDVLATNQHVSASHKHHSHSDHFHGHSHSHSHSHKHSHKHDKTDNKASDKTDKQTQDSDKESKAKDTAQHCHYSESHHTYYSQKKQSYSNELTPQVLQAFLLLYTLELNTEVKEEIINKVEPPPPLRLDYIAQTKVLRGPPIV